MQIAASPRDSGFEDFDWRVSMARVERDGAFSHFSGVDRALVVLQGEGIALTVGDAMAVALTPASPPFGFAGDTPTRGILLGGAITDLNVMTRRGKFASRLTRLDLNVSRVVAPRARDALLVIAEGGARLSTADGAETLVTRDAWLGAEAGAQLRLDPNDAALIYLIEIFDVAKERM
jgi:environmental stress-induced protein Ves